MFGLYLDMEFTSANPAKCSGRILHGDGLLSDPIALDVTALRPETRTEGLVVKLVGLGPMAASRRDSWKRPCWRRPGRTPGRCRPPTSPSTGPSPEKDQPPEAAISESGLRSTFEAQARLIYMSDPIPIDSLA
ncbi:hypothetical protein AB7M73_011656 [Bradyrhizobium japonicum]